MNKKRKLGIYLLISPFALLIISFVLTLLANFVISTPSTTSESVTFNIVNIVLAITSLISVVGIILFPILAIIGIVLIVKNKDEKPVEPTVIATNPEVSTSPIPTPTPPVQSN
jgi:hypothetical protein